MFKDIYNKLANLIRRHQFIRRYPATKELIKFAIVGNTNNFIDLALYIYITRMYVYWQENYILANIFTMFLASITRFIAHKFWTFRDTSKSIEVQYMKFSSIMALGMVTTMLTIIIAVELLSIHDIIAKILGMIVGSLFTFSLVRNWVFDNRQK